MAAPPRISLTRFFAFGDSLTWGQDGQDDGATPLAFHTFVKVNVPYPADLQLLLGFRYTQQVNLFGVLNEGCPGEEAGSTKPSPCEGASNAVARFGQVVRGGTYDAALIMEGSNDVGEIPGDALAEDRAVAALQSMIDYAKLFNIRPYLATIPPQNPNGGVPSRVKGAAFVQSFNARLNSLALAEGIPLVDVYSNIDSSMLAPDGLHLRQVGYDKVAHVFLDKLAATAEFSTSSFGAAALKARPAK